MEKDFDSWNKKKQKINLEGLTRQCHDGEVWVVAVGVNVGKEIDGKGEIFARPVLVLKRCNQDTFIGVALTKTQRESKWYIPLVIDNISGSVNISQIRLFDQRRLLRLIEKIKPDDFKKIKIVARDLFI